MYTLSEDWTTCPYDPAHRVPKSRIQYHIVKCQKNKPTLEICPFNATHRFPKKEIQEHCKNCPEKPPVDLSRKQNGGLVTTPRQILQNEYLSENDPEYECWDD